MKESFLNSLYNLKLGDYVFVEFLETGLISISRVQHIDRNFAEIVKIKMQDFYCSDPIKFSENWYIFGDSYVDTKIKKLDSKIMRLLYL